MAQNTISPDDIPEVIEALTAYISEDEKKLAPNTTYGGFGKILERNHGKTYNNSSSGGYMVEGTPARVLITVGNAKYEMTWNKAAKLIHPVLCSMQKQPDIMTLEETPIEDAGLSVRAFNTVRRVFPGAVTLGDLKNLISDDPKTLNLLDNTEFRELRLKLELSLSEIAESYTDDTETDSTAVPENVEIPKGEIMSDTAKHAYTVHAQIVLGAQMVEDGLYQMAKGFKIMRDEKLYKELGYKSFEEYCETETGISRMQVYNYIRIADKIPEAEFVNSGLQNVGVKKLTLLSTLTDEQRTEITENTDLENTTVRELRAKIDELTGKNKKLSENVESLKEDIENLTTDNERLEADNGELTGENTDLEEERDGLKKQLAEMREEQQKVHSQIIATTQENTRLKDRNDQLFSENKELRERPVETVTVEGDPTESEEYKSLLTLYDNLGEQYDELEEENERLREQRQSAPAGLDHDHLREFFETLYGKADDAFRDCCHFLKEDYPDETKEYVRERVAALYKRFETYIELNFEED